ncbi:lipopolysaccharide transport periplasmic protein LptA [Shewanella gelidii]|uniref:Lipopolysaccharide export system protein LptA n=1 Tax=Shewanella gelidii TaxID=1642821 RepID=A0A917JP04_9GAMM|nr:lipopolysaccharide transport periplasmic protein LptA [Shewanella gelidii]MCL1097682.1 lipopolysaccharide transport periplasmic protein LptA [Shewanella gelidii]GGI79597.1 lipopolysaccharide export system protein LptA [Shewanella gelidii]
MKRTKLMIAAILCTVSVGAIAKQGDLKQQVKVQAVKQNGDIKNNQVIYYGPVEVTQGSIKINADELRAFTEKKSNNSVIVATGTPATYSQEMDDGRIATASANEIRYEIDKRTMTLKGDATLDQAGSKVSASQIRYDIARQQLIAESSGQGDDRVITIIKPQNYEELPTEGVPQTEQPKNNEPDTAPMPKEPESK